jgi:hypothetical protein
LDEPGILDQLGRAGIAAVLFGLLSQSFCCNLGYSDDSVVEVAGRVVSSESHGMNYGALVLGPLGLVFGLAALVIAVRGEEHLRTGRLLVAAIGTALAFHGLWGSVW